MKIKIFTTLLLACWPGSAQALAGPSIDHQQFNIHIQRAEPGKLFPRTSSLRDASVRNSSIGSRRSRSSDAKGYQESGYGSDSRPSRSLSMRTDRNHRSFNTPSGSHGSEADSQGQATVQSPNPPRRINPIESLRTPSPRPSTSGSDITTSHGESMSITSNSPSHEGGSPSPGSSENSSRRGSKSPVKIEAEITGPGEIFTTKGRGRKGLAWHKTEAGETKRFKYSHPHRLSSEIRVYDGGRYQANSVGNRAWAGIWTKPPVLHALAEPARSIVVGGSGTASSYGGVQGERTVRATHGGAVITKGTGQSPWSASGANSMGEGKMTSIVAAANFGVPIERGEPRYSYEQVGHASGTLHNRWRAGNDLDQSRNPQSQQQP